MIAAHCTAAQKQHCVAIMQLRCAPLLAAGLKVYAAMIDAELNEQGQIVPGLGDAGDRAFNTL